MDLKSERFEKRPYAFIYSKTAVQFDLEAWETLRPLFEEVMEDAPLAQLMNETIDD